MADDYVDPSGSTEQFRAFVQDTTAAPQQKKSRAGLIAGIVVAVLILAGLAWLAFS
jgi:hypothetical protein